MPYIINMISQHCFDFDPTWFPLFSNEVSNSWGRSGLKDSSGVCIESYGSIFVPQMAITVDTYYYNMKILQLFMCIGVYEFGFLHLFSTSFSILVSGLYMLYPNYYCSSYILLTMPDLGCYNCSYKDIGCPGLRLALSTGPERTDVSHLFMCGWKQTVSKTLFFRTLAG